jgi:hypothetical protein
LEAAADIQERSEMGKVRTGWFGEHLLSDLARAIKEADSTVRAALEREHSWHWRRASTAPYNQDLELRVTEDGSTHMLPFPCRRTNADQWINVDLGAPLQIQPVEWRAWLRRKSPHPHQSSIFGSDGLAVYRWEKWRGVHEAADAIQGSLKGEPEA